MNSQINTFLIIFSFCFIAPIESYCQNQCKNKSMETQINHVDSLGNKVGVWIDYDIENIKCSETKYSSPNKVEYTKYFTRKGKEINVYTWKLNNCSLSILTELIKNKFILNDSTFGNGSAILLLLADCENNIYEIRIIRGISIGFNNELLRVTKDLEKNLIFISPDDCKIPIVTPFAIRIN